MPPELQLAALPVGRLQLHAEQQLGRGARAHVAPYPHHRRRLLGGLCGGISGQLSGDVRHRSVSFSAIGRLNYFQLLFVFLAHLLICTWKTDFLSPSLLFL